jgi:hypothetical protein
MSVLEANHYIAMLLLKSLDVTCFEVRFLQCNRPQFLGVKVGPPEKAATTAGQQNELGQFDPAITARELAAKWQKEVC